MEKVNILEKFTQFREFWSPKIVGEVNETQIKLVKIQGSFIWHHHDEEDELFWVIQGRLVIHLRDGQVVLDEGEFAVIPRGVEHLPEAEEETYVVLLERKTTLNTGNVQNERTKQATWIDDC